MRVPRVSNFGATPIDSRRTSQKDFGAGRVCAEDECDTVLTRYNKLLYCYVHRPYKKARTRGRTAKSAELKIYKCRMCATRQTAWRGKVGSLPEKEIEGLIHRVKPDGSSLCKTVTR